MDCQSFRDQVIAARKPTISAGAADSKVARAESEQEQSLRAHAAGCEPCAAWLAGEEFLRAGFEDLRQQDEQLQAPATLQAALGEQFRRLHAPATADSVRGGEASANAVPEIAVFSAVAPRRRDRRGWWLVAAAAALVIAAWFTISRDQGDNSPENTIARTAPSQSTPASEPASKQVDPPAGGPATPEPATLESATAQSAATEPAAGAALAARQRAAAPEPAAPAPAAPAQATTEPTLPLLVPRPPKDNTTVAANHEPSNPGNPGAAGTTQGRRELVTEFVPLTYGGRATPAVDAQLVRVRLPSTALAYLGLPGAAAAPPVTASSSPAASPSVEADVLLGADGLAYAVRFVRPILPGISAAGRNDSGITQPY